MKIDIHGFKNCHRSAELGRLAYVTGPNGSGKSAIMDGIRWAITGAVPTGNGVEEINRYCDGASLMAVARVSAGDNVLACSSLSREGSKTKRDHHCDSDFNAPLLNPRELITASSWGRVKWFAEALGVDIDEQVAAEDIDNYMTEITREESTATVEALSDFMKERTYPTSLSEVSDTLSSLRDRAKKLSALKELLVAGPPQTALEMIAKLAPMVIDGDERHAPQLLACCDAYARHHRELSYQNVCVEVFRYQWLEKALKSLWAHEVAVACRKVAKHAGELASAEIAIREVDDELRIYYNRKPLESISAGESVVCLAAICAAISLQRPSDSGRLNVIVTEADPCDYANLIRVTGILKESGADLAIVATWQPPSTEDTLRLVESDWTIVML